ncbi:hypothetical protein [Burkholderia sp. Ac-20344]|uniref:hypothetical protein n=1 Tax=Burkholderia sp. Ac-20344 TaxID=2703890 RepID=UPI00197B6822|nr:hypothetical protein [Burkholderia sp. Ac-20344]MBN3831492.1 hypothetical protein [Burkholderia sp. Ac-20344]
MSVLLMLTRAGVGRLQGRDEDRILPWRASKHFDAIRIRPGRCAGYIETKRTDVNGAMVANMPSPVMANTGCPAMCGVCRMRRSGADVERENHQLLIAGCKANCGSRIRMFE